MRQSKTKTRLMIGGAVAAVVIAGAGVMIFAGSKPAEAPVEATAAEAPAHGADALPMDAARIQAAGIVLAPVEDGSLSAEILAQGTVAGTPQGRPSSRPARTG